MRSRASTFLIPDRNEIDVITMRALLVTKIIRQYDVLFLVHTNQLLNVGSFTVQNSSIMKMTMQAKAMQVILNLWENGDYVKTLTILFQNIKNSVRYKHMGN